MTTDLHEAAIEAGATVLGDPPHYLLTEEQLAAFIRLSNVQVLSELSQHMSQHMSDVKIVLPPPY